MTFKEALQKEKKWHRRALIISLYHNKMCLARKKWTLRLTAMKLHISLGFVAESVKLAKAINENNKLENLTRAEALREIRNGRF